MDSILGFIPGAIFGLAFGVITNIIGGGLIATILNMDDNLEKLVGKIYTSKTTSENS